MGAGMAKDPTVRRTLTTSKWVLLLLEFIPLAYLLFWQWEAPASGLRWFTIWAKIILFVGAGPYTIGLSWRVGNAVYRTTQSKRHWRKCVYVGLGVIFCYTVLFCVLSVVLLDLWSVIAIPFPTILTLVSFFVISALAQAAWYLDYVLIRAEMQRAN